jgi:hypothetical protein
MQSIKSSLSPEIEAALDCLVAQNLLPKSAKRAILLAHKKSQDYNSSIARDAYFPFGVTSFSHMINVKSLRLVNLSMSKEPPNFESIEDTSIDLFNYCCFLLDYLDRKSK